ncbi:DUF3182 family protein [Achromobacter arsenitoxydans]|uniref:Biotin carboxylase n=1 Tax=Achromobacter arsenitoxydans SY8 TaxID=477184 RepID=H0FBJ5_9BURK|nr:DUF3182 family protein [Achromobacter arsenitoxydans]EHK64460.1 hypothetical protein KYC_20759 [Achromobacter arsenitoxydans SY8]
MNRPLPPASGTVAAYPRRAGASEHEIASQEALALRLAALLGRRFVPDFRPTRHRGEPAPYYVPDRSITSLARAAKLGITRAADLYGGVTPHAFVATKSITHGVLDAQSRTPQGWVRRLAGDLREVVLRGFSAFALDDAQRAGELMLKDGPLRLKPADANAGRGQIVARTPQELRAALASQDPALVRRLGLVLEEDLTEIATYSVGWVRVGKLEASYVGTQGLTPDNDGVSVYGGSTLRFARGGFDHLRALELSDDERRAVDLACRYDTAVSTAYPDFFASRRNYDVAIGRNDRGDARSGVLEQSWRAGGASIAELSALQAFMLSPSLKTVTAATRERYGKDEPVPTPQRYVYRGEDSAVGMITKSGGVLEESNGRI